MHPSLFTTPVQKYTQKNWEKKSTKEKEDGEDGIEAYLLEVLGTNRGIQPMSYTQTGVEYENIK